MTTSYAKTLGLEVVLVGVAATLLGGLAGDARWAAAAAGTALMGVVAVPSLLGLLWGREQSHQTFMLVVGAVILGKVAFVGGAVLFVYRVTDLPLVDLVLGLLLGWVVSFLVLAVTLIRTLKGPAPALEPAGAGPQAERGAGNEG